MRSLEEVRIASNCEEGWLQEISEHSSLQSLLSNLMLDDDQSVYMINLHFTSMRKASASMFADQAADAAALSWSDTDHY